MEGYEISNIVILVGAVIFLFNMVKEENMSFKYGINTFNSKYMPIFIFILYLIAYKYTEGKDSIIGYSLDPNLFLVIMILFAVLSACRLKNILEKIIEYKDKFKPSYIKHNASLIVLVLYFSFIMFFPFNDVENDFLKIIILKIGSIPIKMINIIIIVCMLITVGCLFYLAQIYNCKKCRLIYKTELADVLEAINVKTENNFIDVYVISESKESINVKICEEECVSINVKKEYIKGLVFIDDSKEKADLKKFTFTYIYNNLGQILGKLFKKVV